MKKQIFSIFIIPLVLLIAVLVSAECRIKFTTKINGYSGASFEAGIINGASDSYDPIFDVLQPGMPAGKYIQMVTSVDNKLLAKDFRSDANNKKWEITKIAFDPDYEGLTGTDSLTWTINCSDNIKLSLIDYGNDKTRTKIIKTINLKQTSSYNTEVSNVMGVYRYLNLIAEKTEECIEEWRCSVWSECIAGEKTKSCQDINNCGSTSNKPIEKESCKIETNNGGGSSGGSGGGGSKESKNTQTSNSEKIYLNKSSEEQKENQSSNKPSKITGATIKNSNSTNSNFIFIILLIPSILALAFLIFLIRKYKK